MGMLDEAFMVFCEGLGSSISLVELDLRNNQISHHGAAELCTALKRNTTLLSLGKSNNERITPTVFVLSLTCYL